MLQEVLQSCYLGNEINQKDLDFLLVNDSFCFNSTRESIYFRWNLFHSVCLDVIHLCKGFNIFDTDKILLNLWELWLPFAIDLTDAKSSLNRPLVQGILGVQGTGKTTLCRIVSFLVGYLGYSCISISIDDLYLTYDERVKLQQNNPFLIWRGPPSTHDVALGVKVLDELRNPHPSTPVSIPRFDKSAKKGMGDRTVPELVDKVDIVLFEGWFVGVKPLPESVFDNPPRPIITDEDKIFAKEMNHLLQNYLPLWERIDRLMVLYPLDYRISKEWRKEAERKRIQAGNSGMTDEEIDSFVEYFWRSLHPKLFIPPLTKEKDWVNLVVEINNDRSYTKIYRP